MKKELVRISDNGEAHAIGAVASRRMRERQGAFRMLPSPRHVVFMRYTGEDGRRDAEDGAVVRLAGEITAPAMLCDVLAMVSQARWAGELAVTAEDVQRSVFLENGNIVGVETSVPEERLGQILYRFGAVDEAQLAKIEGALVEGKRIGEAAVELGMLTREQIYGYLGKQIEEIVFSCLSIADGTYFFLEGFAHDRLVSHHVLSCDMVLMDAVTRLDEIRYFRNKIPSDEWVPVRLDRSEAPEPEYQAVLAAIDGKKSVAELGRATGLGEFQVTKGVYALTQSRHAAIHPPRMSGGLSAIVEIANAVLRRVHDEVDWAEKGRDFRASLSSYAEGAGAYEIVLRGAGPDVQGAFDPDRIAENVAHVAGEDPDEYLKGKLYGYVSFALFIAGAALGKDAEHALSSELDSMLAALQPLG